MHLYIIMVLNEDGYWEIPAEGGLSELLAAPKKSENLYPTFFLPKSSFDLISFQEKRPKIASSSRKINRSGSTVKRMRYPLKIQLGFVTKNQRIWAPFYGESQPIEFSRRASNFWSFFPERYRIITTFWQEEFRPEALRFFGCSEEFKHPSISRCFSITIFIS